MITLMNKLLLALLLFAGFADLAFAGSKQLLTVEGTIFDAAGTTAITHADVVFSAQIVAPNGCLLWQETFSAMDLSSSKGGFVLSVGGGSNTASGALSWSSVFKNGVNLTSLTGSGCPGSYNGASSDDRTLYLTFSATIPSTIVAQQVPAIPIKANAQNAMIAGIPFYGSPNSGDMIQFNGTDWVATPVSSGTLNSVGLAVPSIFSIAGSPVTGTGGTMTLSLASQAANTFFAAPNAAAGAPTFRALVANDLTSALPTQAGHANEYLKTDGAGNLSWAAAAGGAGDITDVIAGTGLTGGAVTGAATLNVDVGLGANKIPQVGGTAISGNSIVLSNGTGALTSSSLSNGQLLIGSTGFAPVSANITGTANQVSVSNGAGSITLSTPQNIHSAATPTFAGLTLSGFTGPVKSSAGVLSAGNISLASEVSGTLPIVSGGTGAVTATGAMNAISPLTTKGDLLARDASNNVRLPVGTDGQVLTADSAQASGIKWATISGSGITSLNSLTSGTQTFATGTTGTDFGISSVGSTHTFNLPNASLTTRGALSAADWSMFNAKVSSSGATSYLAKFTSPTSLANSLLYESGGKIGTGTIAPQENLVIHSTSSTGTAISVSTNGITANQQTMLNLFTKNATGGNLAYANASTKAWQLFANGDAYSSGPNDFGISFFDGISYYIPIYARQSKVSIGSGATPTVPTTALDVQGTLKVANGGEACSIAGHGGMIRYTASNLQYCNGSSWQTLSAGGGGISSLNGLTGSAQTFVAGTTGSDVNISSAGAIHNINIPTASATNRGALSSADWSAFNGKLSNVNSTAFLTNGKIWVGDAGNLAQERTPAGDVSMSNAGAFVVTQLQGRAVQNVSPTIGAMLKWNNSFSRWEPMVLPTCDSTNNLMHYNSVIDVWSCDPIVAAGANGQLQFNNTSGLGGTSDIYWDSVNQRLGIGTSTPQHPFVISKDASFSGGFYSVASINGNVTNNASPTAVLAARAKPTINGANQFAALYATVDYSNGNVGTGGTAIVGEIKLTSSPMPSFANVLSTSIENSAGASLANANVMHADIKAVTGDISYAAGYESSIVSEASRIINSSENFRAVTTATGDIQDAKGYAAAISAKSSGGSSSSAKGLSIDSIFSQSNSSAAQSYGLYLSNISANTTSGSANAYGIYIGSLSASGGTNSRYSIYSSDVAAPSYFAGKVGIGTTSPQFPLQVEGGSALLIADNIFADYKNETYGAASWGGFQVARARGTKSTPTALQTGDELGHYRFNGYGTTSFSSGVQVAQISAVAAENFTDTSKATDVVFMTTSTGSSVGTEKMRIRANGNIGIGTALPTYQLQLSSDSAAKPGTSSWTIASDQRLKDIRAPFQRGLAAIEDIHPIYFRYKQNNALSLPSEKEFVGIIAQDAERAIPEAVARDEKGFLHVTNDAIFWTLLNAVKEFYQQWKGDSVATAIKMQKLEQENAALKTYLCEKDPQAPFCR